jgi:hypothetical protein
LFKGAGERLCLLLADNEGSSLVESEGAAVSLDSSLGESEGSSLGEFDGTANILGS